MDLRNRFWESEFTCQTRDLSQTNKNAHMCLTQKYIFWSPWWPLGVAKTNSMSPCSWDIFDYILQIILFIKEA